MVVVFHRGNKAMVYKLKPLELSLDFEDRDYELGETVDVQVTLTPNGPVDVREARVDLVCEECYSRRESGVVIPAGGSGYIQGGAYRVVPIKRLSAYAAFPVGAG